MVDPNSGAAGGRVLKVQTSETEAAMGELIGGDSGTKEAHLALQGSEAFIEERRPQEPAVMCGQEGRNAARASCTQRRHKNTRRYGGFRKCTRSRW
mgnify:CR=1 FL=1